jgi:hypothetical protein
MYNIISDLSRKEAMLAKLQIELNSDTSAGYLRFPGKSWLLVKGDLWTTWSQDTSSVPLYILDGSDHQNPLLTSCTR